MARKIYDLAVKTGEYTNRNGETKGRWMNIGAAMEGDDGNRFLSIDRTFNPAGVPNPDNRTNVIVSMFPPKDRQSGPPNESDPASPQYSGNAANFDDDIPF